jgi:hypothetical protein
MVPEQVIRRVDDVVGEHIDQFAVLAGPGGHQVAGLLNARRGNRARGEQQPRDLGKSWVARQLQQVRRNGRPW